MPENLERATSRRDEEDCPLALSGCRMTKAAKTPVPNSRQVFGKSFSSHSLLLALDRCHPQFKLVRSMEQQEARMNQLVETHE
jgi:hypothetical protein